MGFLMGLEVLCGVSTLEFCYSDMSVFRQDRRRHAGASAAASPRRSSPFVLRFSWLFHAPLNAAGAA